MKEKNLKEEIYFLVDNAIVQSVFSSLSHFCDQLIVFAWLQESSLDIQLHTFLGLLDAVVAKLDCAKKTIKHVQQQTENVQQTHTPRPAHTKVAPHAP